MDKQERERFEKWWKEYRKNIPPSLLAVKHLAEDVWAECAKQHSTAWLSEALNSGSGVYKP